VLAKSTGRGSRQTDIRVGNNSFGKDPAFGKTKTLSVIFLQGGVQYQTTLSEGEQISFATPNAVQLNAAPQVPSAATAELKGQTQSQTLSPGATMWLVQRIAIRTKGGVTGIEPGTKVILVEDHGDKLLVSDGSQTIEIAREMITTDAAVAHSAAQSVAAEQAAVAQFNAKVKQEADAKEKAMAEQRPRAAKAQQEQAQREAAAERAHAEAGAARRPVGDSLSRIGGGGGVGPSSIRFKEKIESMDKTSESIPALKPVTFHYKQELDPLGIPQFGLVAEEVEKVSPELVTREPDVKLYGVRYDAVNAMLLNEFLKEHRKLEEQGATITQLKKEMEAVVARLNDQDAKIQTESHQKQSGPAR